MGKQPNDWCILRTGPASTMKLTTSLQEAGFEVWTPVERTERRVPRGSAVRKAVAVLTPTYVFARQKHLAELRMLEAMQITAHPSFSVFRHFGNTVLVPHRALHELRAKEQKSYRESLPIPPHSAHTKPRGEPFEQGKEIKFKTGPYAGLDCYVERSDGRITTLSLNLFGRTTELQIETSKLRADSVTAIATAA